MNMKVFVYCNLHKKLWSVKALEGENKGRVIAHMTEFVIKDCTFKISEAGRQRVIREQRKNVHAGVVGVISTEDSLDFDGVGHPITYNPYRTPSFVMVTDDSPVYTAKIVYAVGRDIKAVL